MSRRRSRALSVRLSPAQVDVLRCEAARRGVTVSELVRRAGLAAAARPLPPTITVSGAVSGAWMG